jgi:hypothetical protein
MSVCSTSRRARCGLQQMSGRNCHDTTCSSESRIILLEQYIEPPWTLHCPTHGHYARVQTEFYQFSMIACTNQRSSSTNSPSQRTTKNILRPPTALHRRVLALMARDCPSNLLETVNANGFWRRANRPRPLSVSLSGLPLW